MRRSFTMELHLKNIGTLQEANIKIDGLTIIAGENGTGKSTLSKALFALIKSENLTYLEEKERFTTRLNLLFEDNVSQNGSMCLLDNDKQEIVYAHIIEKNHINAFKRITPQENNFLCDATLIQSPIVLDIVNFDITFPYLMNDLCDKISKPSPLPQNEHQIKITEEIEHIIEGKFQQENGKFFFHQSIATKTLKIEMTNTDCGIKSFGLLQFLNENSFLNAKTCLILDNVEAYLHPKWQLEMAKIIVHLVKNGMTILVNSHSPYIIEALQKYSELAKINSNFYIAQDHKIEQIEGSNSKTLAQIFKKFAEPFDVFEQMDSEALLHG